MDFGGEALVRGVAHLGAERTLGAFAAVDVRDLLLLLGLEIPEDVLVGEARSRLGLRAQDVRRARAFVADDLRL